MNILKICLFMLFLGLFEAAVPDIEDRFKNLEDQVKKLEDQMRRLNNLEENVRSLSKTVEDVVRILQQNKDQKVEENTGKTQLQIVEQIEKKNAENNNGVTMSNIDLRMNKKSENDAIRKENDVIKMNDTDLEQRVQILELQMNNVIDDVTTLTDDVTDLEEDIDTQVTLLQADVTFIQADQTTQDQRILELETDTESIAGAIFDLNNNVTTLKTADAAIFGEIDNLELSDIGLDSRLESLEVNGTVAFFVTLGPYTSIPEDSVVLFQEVRLNNGNGYNSLTGEFTVPPGGGGLYYFEAYFLINYDGEGVFQIRMNGAAVCPIIGVFILSTDRSTSSCGTTAQLQEGDIVDVFYNGGTDDTPVFEAGNKQNGFTGFRVAPQ